MVFRGFTRDIMPTATGPPPPPNPVHRKTSARVALFDLPLNSAQLITECFRQFGIETVSIPPEQSSRLKSEKFEACVLPLGKDAGSIIALPRASASNTRVITHALA